jgi:pimeloyl-ACP methyl ester carboxylesterase
MLFQKLSIENVICIGHDMGDTVLAELVKRRHRNILSNLNIEGVAFSNGGINFKYAKLRLAQHLLRIRLKHITLTYTLF